MARKSEHYGGTTHCDNPVTNEEFLSSIKQKLGDEATTEGTILMKTIRGKEMVTLEERLRRDMLFYESLEKDEQRNTIEQCSL